MHCLNYFSLNISLLTLQIQSDKTITTMCTKEKNEHKEFDLLIACFSVDVDG